MLRKYKSRDTARLLKRKKPRRSRLIKRKSRDRRGFKMTKAGY
jgi:hypothetical protein